MKTGMLGMVMVLTAGSAASAQYLEWTKRVAVSEDGFQQGEVAIAASRTTGDVVVAWMKAQPDGMGLWNATVWYNASLDGAGFDTGNARQIPGPGDGDLQFDPMAAFSPVDGTLWVGAVNATGATGGFWIARKDPGPDSGSQFLTDPAIAPGVPVDKGLLTVGPAFQGDSGLRMHVAYTGTSGLMRGITSSSSPLGDSWPDASQTFVIGPGTNGGVGQGAIPIVLQQTGEDPNIKPVRLVVAFNPAYGSAFTVPAITWTVGDGSWTNGGPTQTTDPVTGALATLRGIPLQGGFSPALEFRANFPSIATGDPAHPNRLYMVLSGTGPVDGVMDDHNADLFVAMSDDRGDTFRAIDVLHLSDATLHDADGTLQIMPSVSIDPDGAVNILYYSARVVSGTWNYTAKYVRISNFLADDPVLHPRAISIPIALAASTGNSGEFDLTGVPVAIRQDWGMGDYVMIDSRFCASYAGYMSRHEGGPLSVYVSRIRYCAPDPACYANCDASTSTPLLNVNDFNCFLQAFAHGDPYANCDGSTAPPIINVADFTCFFQKFAMGCN